MNHRVQQQLQAERERACAGDGKRLWRGKRGYVSGSVNVSVSGSVSVSVSART